MACLQQTNRSVCFSVLPVTRVLHLIKKAGAFRYLFFEIKELVHVLAMDISNYGDTWKVWRALKRIAFTLLVALQTSRVHPKLTHTKDEVILNLKMRKLLLQY